MTLVPKVRLIAYTATWVLAVSAFSWCIGCLLMYLVFFRHLYYDFYLDSYSPCFTIPLSLGFGGFFVIGDVYVYRRVTPLSIVFVVVFVASIMLILAAVLYVGMGLSSLNENARQSRGTSECILRST